MLAGGGGLTREYVSNEGYLRDYVTEKPTIMAAGWLAYWCFVFGWPFAAALLVDLFAINPAR